MATVRYISLKEGNCPVHILENDKDISHSPFISHIEKIEHYVKNHVYVLLVYQKKLFFTDRLNGFQVSRKLFSVVHRLINREKKGQTIAE